MDDDNNISGLRSWAFWIAVSLLIPGCHRGQGSFRGLSVYEGATCFGSCLNADALANTVVGGSFLSESSFGFRAHHSGSLQALRVYLVWSSTKPGYNAGSGGSLLIRLQSDVARGGHHPSGVTAGSILEPDPMHNGMFPLLTFPSPVKMDSGTVYHLVFTNVDPDPSNNYVSINSLWMESGLVPRQPAINDADWFQLMRDSSNHGTWVPREYGTGQSFTPILELDYADGFRDGVGYMEVWVGNPKVVSGTQSVRQLLTSCGRDRRVSAVSVRLRRLGGSDSLRIQLQEAGGATIAVSGVPASAIPLTYTWITFSYPSVPRLTAGAHYALVLNCAATSSYDLFPIRKGSTPRRFQAGAFFPDGYAQFTGGGRWKGWDQWGEADRHDGDLQFYFSVVPD